MIDFITIALVILLTFALAIPLIINGNKNKRLQRSAKKRFTEFAQRQGFSLSVLEFWRNHYFIGLDEQNLQLFYADGLQVESPQIIDLKHVHHVTIRENCRLLKRQGGSTKIIDRLALELDQSGNHSKKTLEIFDGERFSNIVNEPVLAKVWKERIQASISQPTFSIKKAETV